MLSSPSRYCHSSRQPFSDSSESGGFIKLGSPSATWLLRTSMEFLPISSTPLCPLQFNHEVHPRAQARANGSFSKVANQNQSSSALTFYRIFLQDFLSEKVCIFGVFLPWFPPAFFHTFPTLFFKRLRKLWPNLVPRVAKPVKRDERDEDMKSHSGAAPSHEATTSSNLGTKLCC
jgi:hypothetical protein